MKTSPLLLLACVASSAFGQGPEISVMMGHRHPALYMLFSADNRYLVTGSTDESAIVWDTRTGYQVQRIRRSDLGSGMKKPARADDAQGWASYLGVRGVMPIGVLSGTQTVITAHRDLKIKAWDIQTGSETGGVTVWMPAIPREHKVGVGPLTQRITDEGLMESALLRQALSTIAAQLPHIGQQIASALSDPATRPLGIEDMLLFAVPDSLEFIVVGNDQGVQTLSLPDFRVLNTYKPRNQGNAGFVRRIVVSRDGTKAAVSLYTGRVDVFNPMTGERIATDRLYLEDVPSIGFSDNGERLFAINKDGMVKVCEAATMKEIFRLDAPKGTLVNKNAPTIGLLSPSGDKIYISNYSRSAQPPGVGRFFGYGPMVVGYNVADKTVSFRAAGISLSGSRITQDGKYLVYRSYRIPLYSQVGVAPRAVSFGEGVSEEIDLPPTLSLNRPNSIAVSPNGKLVAFASNEGSVALIDRATGIPIFDVRGLGSPVQKLWVGAGNMLYAGVGGIDMVYLMSRLALMMQDAAMMSGTTGNVNWIDFLRTERSDPNEPREWDASLRVAGIPESDQELHAKSFGELPDFVAPIRAFDMSTGRQVGVNQSHSMLIHQLCESDETTIYSVGIKRDAPIGIGGTRWTREGGYSIPESLPAQSTVMAVSHDGSRRLLVSFEFTKEGLPKPKELTVIDKNGGQIAKFDAARASFDGIHLSLTFTKDGSAILAPFSDPARVRKFDLAQGRFVKDFRLTLVGWESRGVYGLIRRNERYAIHDFEADKLVADLPAELGEVNCFAVNASGSQIAIGHGDSKVSLFDVASKRTLFTLSGHELAVTAVAISSSGNQLYSGSHDGTVRVWDVATRSEKVRYVPLGLTDWVAITPDGKYMSARSGAGLAFRYQGVSYPVEQFDALYNRPDLVLSQITSPTNELVAAYRAAYERRLRRLGIPSAAASQTLDRSAIEIQDRNQLPYLTQQRELKFSVSASAPAGRTLSNLRCWINDVPVDLGEASGSVSGKQSASVQLSVILSAGPNKLQVSVTDNSGVESLFDTHYVRCEIAPPRKKLFVLSVGVNTYADERKNLKYAVNDANSVASVLRTSATRAFDEVVVIDVITDANATREKILAAQEAISGASVDDGVLIFFAGHGLLDPSTYEYYFATHDIDFQDPKGRGVRIDELFELLSKTAARMRVLLLDTCHAGEIDDQSLSKPVVRPDGSGIRGEPVGSAPKATVGLRNSFDLMQQLFSDLNRGIGAHVIAASGGLYWSYEREGHGLFTKSLLDVLQNPQLASTGASGDELRISQIREYVYRRVLELSDGKQAPTSRQENLVLDFRMR
ncbi:MAG: caspase family protein [Fimbriimonadales bacterium]|nr:caspase family protein [Fimbriimonadales bacterium]